MWWGTVIIAVALTVGARQRSGAEVVFAGLFLAHAVVRTLVGQKPVREPFPLVLIAGELLATVLATSLTGWWESPFAFTPLAPIVSAGFSYGFPYAVPLAVAAAAAITLGFFPGAGNDTRLSVEGSTELLVTALVAAYGRQIFGQAEERTETALSRLSKLSEANVLLQQLNAVAQVLPASLDVNEAVTSALDQVRSLLHPDAMAIFLWDGALQSWSVGGVQGARLPASIDEESLPVPVRRAGTWAVADPGAFLVDLSTDGPGLTPAARVGIYAPLIARNMLVGVLVAEAQDPTHLGTDDLPLVTGLAEQAALAIDNAVWFRRLRIVGAEEERTRIARDLHDRVAQALAYLAFELDRIVDLSAGSELTASLQTLRDDIRRVVTEVRDTLYDLRTDVNEAQGFVSTTESFLDRVRARSDLAVHFRHHEERRLPVPLERELWRITQEAVVNVERHARAKTLTVDWSVREQVAEAVIHDDGIGFPAGASGRLDSYGLLGMRERADAIGATLVIDSAPGRGTIIRCRVEVA